MIEPATLFKDFSCCFIEEKPQGFISNLWHWCHPDGVHLLYCEFDTAGFSQDIFSIYSIDIPKEIQQAVPKRKAEFLAGRFLAKRALSTLGLSAEQQQVAVAADRSPVWPSGVLGSISHSTDTALCCVAKATHVSLLGIDCELILSEATAKSIATEIQSKSEAQLLFETGLPAALGTSLIFSAKETLYKALYPKVGYFFGFETAQLCSVDLKEHQMVCALSEAFARQHGLKTHYKIQFSIKGAMVHTLLMQ